jgi:D-sedoheptulose 7-phosphate isomerase
LRNEGPCMTDWIRNSKSYFELLARTMEGVIPQVIDQIAVELLEAYWSDRTVFVFGNGGSATTASHLACDLSKGATKWLPGTAKRFRVVALTDNLALMTAWANDSNYENVFAEPLRNLVRAGDVVIAISGSGNSPNVLKALEAAKSANATIIGLTGFAGGKMRALCRSCIVIPSDNMEVIEDLHLAVCHSLTTVVRTALCDMAHDNIVPISQTAARFPSSACSDFGTFRASASEKAISEVHFQQFATIAQRGEANSAVQDHVDAD